MATITLKKRIRIEDSCSSELNSILPSFFFLTLTDNSIGQKRIRREIENTISRCPDLPEEILLEIMFYLNAKDLHNYKSVSKFFFSSISQRDFITKHLNFIQQRPSEQEILLTTLKIPKNQSSNHEYTQFSVTNIQNNNNNNNNNNKFMLTMKPKKLNFPFHTKHNNMVMALSLQATCDGLLLFQDKYNPKQLYISNPVTSQFEPLPLIRRYCVIWALVRDTVINKYKVFGVNSNLQCTVFTLGETTPPTLNPKWDTCTVSTPTKRSSDSVFSQLILVGKALHWLTTDVYVDQECYCVYSVNVETLKFLRMRISPQLMRLCPEQISTSKVLHLLSEVNKSLCLTFVSPLQLQMFLLKDRVNSIWTKSLTVHLHSLSNQPSFFHGFLSDNTCLVPTKGVDGGDLLDLVKVYIHHGDQLFMYDLKTQECREVGFLSKEQKLCSLYFFNSDSLISWTSV